MPLFPITSEDSKDGHALGERSLLSKGAAPAPTCQVWLQVGQSYHGVVEDRSDQGPKGSKQGSTMLPRDNTRQEMVKDATGSSGMTKRRKAADFFGVPVDGYSPSAGDHTPEVRVTVTEKSTSKTKDSYSSDATNNDNGDKKVNSDLHIRERHSKTGREESSREGHRKRKHKEKERQKKKSKRTRTSSKSKRKSNYREGAWRYSSKSRRETDIDSSESNIGNSSDLELDHSPVREPFKSKRDRGEPKLFVEDRCGDKDNLSFGGFYRIDVPIYHGMGDADRREGVRQSGGGDTVRYFSRQARRSISDERMARVQLWRGDKRRRHMAAAAVGTDTDVQTAGRPTVQNNQQEHNEELRQQHTSGWDFLPLDPTVARFTPQELDRKNVKADDTTVAVNLDVPTECVEQWLTRKMKDFNLLTRQHPDSEDLWLRFADFQEEAVRALQGGGDLRSPSVVVAVSRTSLEKRASVLEGALRQNPNSIKLRMAQLHVAGQVHEHEAVDSLWRGAIQKSSTSLALWLGYLKFKSGHFASFSVEKQRLAFSRCIEVFRCRRLETMQAREKEDRALGVFITGGTSMLQDCREHVREENDLLDVLWSYCLMERAAGYHERALGTLQAMVELNITPRDSPVSVGDLEEFWESETPRIGDAHPSLSGISRRREASAAAKNDLGNDSREGNLAPGGRQATIARKLPVVRALDARDRRKRAVDFFADASTWTKSRLPMRGNSSWSNKSRHGSDAVDVLEKAYHAAEALANKTAAADHDTASSFPSLDRNNSRDSESDKRDAPVRGPIESVLGSESNTAGPSIATASTQYNQHHEKKGRPNPVRQDEYNSAPESQNDHGRDDKDGDKGQNDHGRDDEDGDESQNDHDDDQDDKGVRGVEAEGLIWVDDSQATAYSVRHGYRINVQEGQDSVSGLEYGRILNQVRGDTKDDRLEFVKMVNQERLLRRKTLYPFGTKDAFEHLLVKDVDAVTAAARERKRKEMAEQEAVVEDVPERDPFSSWAKTEDKLTRHQWQPLRATEDEEGAEQQPDRVVFVEDLRPFLFKVSQPASLRKLVQMLISVGGLVFPRSNVSHSHKFMSEASCAASLGDGGLSGSLLCAVSDGLQAVWKASEAELPVSGRGVIRCTGRSGSSLPPLAVSTAADQFLLLTDELVVDVSRQKFVRNVLHHLIRALESSYSNSVFGDDMLVQLQCTLVLFEGYIASTAGGFNVDVQLGSRSTGEMRKISSVEALTGDESYGHEARKVAKSLLEASQASATDLRLWSSYVQLLAILGNRHEAIKVAEKALSLVQALPESKKSLSAEMFWVTFRLHAGLPLTPRDPHVGEDDPPHVVAALASLFERDEKRGGQFEMALLLLCSFAEGRFDRPKNKKPKRGGKSSNPDGSDGAALSPPRLMAARRLMADRVARLAAELPQEGATGATNSISSLRQGGFDMTPSFMYHCVAWVWLEYLTRGPKEAEHAMTGCLAKVKVRINAKQADESTKKHELRGSLKDHTPYRWDVVYADTALGVCLERMHRAFSELMVLAQHYDPVATGPRRVRMVLLRGLRSLPAEPGMLCMLLATEQFSGSQQRLVHHLSEVSRRRVLDWEQGPTACEWILGATHQVMRCVHETRHTFIAPKTGAADLGRESTKLIGDDRGYDRALSVKNWLPGSYARLKRSMEHAVTHPTGRQIPMLWRIYMALEAMRGNHKQARQLFWRAIHSCPGNKSLLMDALRGDQRARMGSMGLRPAFRGKELHEILGTLFEKSLHLRAEPPS